MTFSRNKCHIVPGVAAVSTAVGTFSAVRQQLLVLKEVLYRAYKGELNQV